MSLNNTLADRPPVAVILAGGLGTRLRSIHPECPKPMVAVLGRPFLEYVVHYLEQQGIRDIIISSGYRGHQIESHFGAENRFTAHIRCIQEPQPLGTGGAIAYVLMQVHLGDLFLALNGDSLAAFSVPALLKAGREDADAVVLAVRVSDARRFGRLALHPNGRLKSFSEKATGASSALISAGVYLLRPEMIPGGKAPRPTSIERDFFPRWLREGKEIAVVQSDGPFIDIGTPKSLEKAAGFLKQWGGFSSLVT